MNGKEGYEKAVTEKQVHVQLGRLEDSLDRLDKATINLQEQLGPVLRTDLVKDNVGEHKETDLLVPLACTIRTCHRHTDTILERIEYFIEGLQV